jgi:hypothetical protein
MSPKFPTSQPNLCALCAFFRLISSCAFLLLASRLLRTMGLFLSNKVVRLLLAASVSIWMAGGCLFGCSSNVIAADAVDEPVSIVEAGDSCHAARAHDCCAAKKPKQQSTRKVKQPEGRSAFTPASRGPMQDCPLVVNATAATAKSSTPVPEPARVPVAVLPQLEKQTQLTENIFVVQYLPNRGPTHLRCCVFLI